MKLIAIVRLAVSAVVLLVTSLAHSGKASGIGGKGGTTELPKANMQEALVGSYVLPDPLGGPRAVRTVADWQARRTDILNLFAEHVYGHSPDQPASLKFQVLEHDPRALGGAATLKRIAVVSGQDGRSHRFVLTLYLPNGKQRPVPVFLVLNHRNSSAILPAGAADTGASAADTLVSRGFGVAEIQTSEVAPDSRSRFRNGVIELFEGDVAERPANAWGAVAAWAWGARRALDYLVTKPRIDARRIILVGHSRGGKAALWAGALDQRFAMVIANNSGEGGAALARRNFGETVAIMNQSFPHWFADTYKQYNNREEALPVDQHMLLSLIAPRPLYIASATEDKWADPRGEFLSLAHSSPVYGLWKDLPISADDMPAADVPLMVGRRGYHLRTGAHDLKLSDWNHFMNFAGRMWKKQRDDRRN